MRALISSRGDRSEDGVVLLWVALMMVALIGMGALVIDVGAAYVERRQLQNGADAAALAVAADCALGNCQDESATANAFADSNANDNASNIDSVCGSGPGLAACATPPSGTAGATGYVQVTTSTHNPANADDTQVRFFLAPVLDAANVGATVHATAAAAWGPPAAASTIPLIFSFCEFAELGGSVNPPVFPSGTAIISFHGSVPAGTCPAGPSGADLPGGFGWLDAGGDCEADIDAGGWVDDKTGNGVPNGCDPADWRNVEVLLPVYDQTNGLTGSNGEYHVIGFAGFRITGYRFPGNRWPDSFPDCPLEPGNSGTCIRGEFTRVTATGDEFGGPDLGARIIKMIG